MVQAPPRLSSGGQSADGPALSRGTQLNNRNREEFAAHWKRSGHPLHLDAEAPVTACAVPESPSTKPRELSDEERSERYGADLAPGELTGLGRGSGAGDAAELLALLNPGGDGRTLPAVAEVVTPPEAGAAQVAELVERWVRRVAIGGDPRRGVARLDIGQGRYAGAELWVSTEGGRVSVELNLAEVPSDPSLADRLRSRLEERGYAADVVVR